MSRYEEYAGTTEYAIPKTMQAVVLSGRGFENLRVVEVPVPQIAPDELLARVDAAGVCTSILKLLAQGQEHAFINGWDLAKWPVILGDEGAVTLVRIGEGLREQYRPGQRFAIQPAVAVEPILHRERYRNNAEGMHKCCVGYTLGGNLAQYIRIQPEVLRGGCLLPLPAEDMPYFAASMGEPISCIYSAQERNYHIIKEGPHAPREPQMGLLAGGVTVVVGAGAMGRIHAEMALRFGPRVLIVSDLPEQKSRLEHLERTIGGKARDRGVQLICVTADQLKDRLMQVSGGRGGDDILLAVGVNAVQQEALGMLADGGVANLFGGLPRGKHILQLDSLAVHYREIKVVGSSGGDPSDMAATLEAIAKGDIDPGNYVAGVGSLDNAIDVLHMIEHGQIDGKGILYPHVRPTPLRRVDRWGGPEEKAFFEERLAD